MDATSLTELFDAHFPARGGRAELTFVEVTDDYEHPTAVMRLITRNAEGMIDNIKEQPVMVCWTDQLDDPRLPAVVEGTAEAFRDAAEQAAPGKIDVLMPSDLWFGPELLKLERAETVADFVDALLRTKGRYGKMLP
mgnify:CR=1 FL=1